MGLERIRVGSLAVVILAFGSGSIAANAPLADAAEKNDRVAIRSLIERRDDVNRAQIDGMTALHWAAYHDDLETAKLLLGARAEVKTATRYAVTPLSLACTNGNEAMVRMFLEAGADPNTKLR